MDIAFSEAMDLCSAAGFALGPRSANYMGI